MRTRGKYFWKEKWYSFCSRHQEHDDTCQVCNFGTWRNVVVDKISHTIFKYFPKLWIFLSNL